MPDSHDLFDLQAKLYAQFRPDYPHEMLNWIVGKCFDTKCLWDCATGNGQVATVLADQFDKVIATDISKEQLSQAELKDNICYKVAKAEQTDIKDISVDLVTVAQALHWFDHDRFNLEVNRILKPGGLLAVWCYGLVQTQYSELNTLIKTFYTDITEPYWASERRHIDNFYSNIPIPFEKIDTPQFEIQKSLSLEALMAYFSTWSPVNTVLKATGQSLVDDWLRPRVAVLNLSGSIACHWPITLIVSRK